MSKDNSEYEWDTYPEPLYDPVASEVDVLVKEYFARADVAYADAEALK